MTQSQAISQSFRVFITFRSMRDTTFFSFFETHFLYKIPLLLPWWSKDVLVVQVAGGQLRNPPVKFRHERWLHLAIDQHPACPNRGRLELWPRKWFLLGRNPWRLACWSIYSPVDVDRRRWSSILDWSHLLTSDLKRCLLFRKCLHWSSLKAVSVPSSFIGGLRGSKRPAILLWHIHTFMQLWHKKVTIQQPTCCDLHWARCKWRRCSWQAKWHAGMCVVRL